MTSPAANEDPDVSLFVQIDAWIVMWIVNCFFVMYNRGFWHDMLAMIVIGDHCQKMALISTNSAAIDEECFPDGCRIDGDRVMFRGISAQTARVLRAIFGALPQVKPDSPITVNLHELPAFRVRQIFAPTCICEGGQEREEQNQSRS